ncbi:MAG TPA: glycosyltransferase family 9 protein [Steroidobacteraceae bacterium]|nr:glycosyltransferase family 9 protein [Steroidobacteraceae bacterium]
MTPRPLAVRCGAFGDMVLLTALIRVLHARFGVPVDILTSGPWSEPLLRGQPGIGDVWSLRSRKAPYWLSTGQRRAVRALSARAPGPTWYCDGNDAARKLLDRAAIPETLIVDVRDHPLRPGEHATEQWRRLAQLTPSALETPPAANAPRAVPPLTDAQLAEVAPGCCLEVGDPQRRDLAAWLRARGLSAAPLILLQIGNKRTMRRGFKRLAVNNKYWPLERWAEVIRHVRERCPRHELVLLGTDPEFELNESVTRLAGASRVHNAADDLPIPRLVALLERARGLITVDSGPAHAAAAVGCPLVALFGKASPTLYRPRGTAGADVKVICGELDGEPDMLGIEARSVIEAFSTLKLRGAEVP